MSTPSYPASEPEVSILDVHLPRRLLILPITGFGLGLFIGMSRGGSKARLRFLAENAHRQPTTVQGWYFYTKTRNYRILFGALKQGSRDAMSIGAATTFYVLTEEGVSSIRSRLMGSRLEDRLINTKGVFGDLQYVDKGIAGGMLGSVVGAVGKFPPGLFVRTMVLGSIFGMVEGMLTVAQAEVAKIREAKVDEEATAAAATAGERLAGETEEAQRVV